MNVDAYAYDWYFSGNIDAIEGMNIVPFGERYLTYFENGDVGYTAPEPRPAKRGFGSVLHPVLGVHRRAGVLWLFGPGAAAGNEVKVWDFSE